MATTRRGGGDLLLLMSSVAKMVWRWSCQIDHVVVDDADPPDPGRGKILSAEPSPPAADHQHARGAQALLAGEADVGWRRAAVAAQFARAQARGNSLVQRHCSSVPRVVAT